MSNSVMGACSCGASSDAPNYECERCRLVYFVLEVRKMRSKAREYLHAQDHDTKALVTTEYKRVESKVDQMLVKFCEQPKQQEFQLGGDGRYYEEGA
ncbi:MAG: hypothetical protein Aurels2KO_10590 [Aureliella sp.]